MISIYSLFESYIFSDDDFKYQFDEWINGDINVLLIIGFSGSGKSTLGKELSKQYNCKYISTDDIHKKCKSEYEKNIQYTNLTNDDLYKIDMNLLDIIYNNYLNSTNKLIIEGIHLLVMDVKLLQKYSIIIKGTSHVKSIVQSTKRDAIDNKSDDLSILKIINGAVTYYKDKILMNINLQKYINNIKTYLSNIKK